MPYYCAFVHAIDLMTSAYGDSWEFFFNKPVHVTDSFYVGFSTNFVNVSVNEEHPLAVYHPHYKCTTTNYLGAPVEDHYDSCGMPRVKVKVRGRNPWDTVAYRMCGMRLNEWKDTMVEQFWRVLPIIMVYDTIWTVDTPACRPVWDFKMLSRYGNTVRLRWSHDGPHNEWQVSYGPQGMRPEDGTMVTCNTNTWSYDDTTGEMMVAYVRTVCRELDTVRYSLWGEGVEWYVQQGIADEAKDATAVILRPNPARDWVEVEATQRVQGIDVYAASGAKVKSLPEGVRGFSVSEWAKGTYLLVVRTPEGKATRKLVVE